MTFWNANATISYTEVTSTQTGTDDITGEPIFEESGNTLTIRVSLENDVIEPRIGVLPGKDRIEHFYSGRLCDPTTLPDWYRPEGGEYDIEFDDGLTGKFYTYPATIGRGLLEDVFGTRIEGVLIT